MDVPTTVLVLGGATGLTLLLSALLGRIFPRFTSGQVKPVVQSKDHEDLPNLRLPNVGGIALIVTLWCFSGAWWLMWARNEHDSAGAHLIEYALLCDRFQR